VFVLVTGKEGTAAWSSRHVRMSRRCLASVSCDIYISTHVGTTNRSSGDVGMTCGCVCQCCSIGSGRFLLGHAGKGGSELRAVLEAAAHEVGCSTPLPRRCCRRTAA